MKASRTITFFLLFSLSFSSSVSFSVPQGKTTGVTFDEALPEDISNENFPDRIDGFNFPEANLLDLVKAIGKLTGVNFIVDPSLQGKRISIITPSSITVAEAYKAFLSALAANGYTIIKSGAFWKIQTTEKSHKDNTEVYSGDYFPNTDQLITRIISLKHINSGEFANSIKWLLSQDNKISNLESSNSIILSDYGSVIERIMKIVYEMDIPGSEEKVQIIPIRYASAEDLAEMLASLLFIESKSKSSFSPARRRNKRTVTPSVIKKESSGTLKISRIIPDARTNSLVISANEEGVKRIHELVSKLDTPVDASITGGVYVYNVLHGPAEEVHNTLMGIKPSKATDKNGLENLSSFSTPSKLGIGRRKASSASSVESPLFQNVKIMSDSNTNSLIISARNRYDYERVLSVLKKIDVPRDQVFIQAIIIEMITRDGDNREFNLAGILNQMFKKTFENNSNYGFLDILGSSLAGFLSQPFSMANLEKATVGPGLILSLPFNKLFNLNKEETQGVNLSASENTLLQGWSDEEQSNYLENARRQNINSSINQVLQHSYIPLIRMLKTVTNVNVLSTPQLTTLDNVKAYIEVGENVPVGLKNTSAVGSIAQNSVDFKDVTLKMEIVPRINPESGTVQMAIKQKFDDLSDEIPTASELAAISVRTVKREIETVMVLHDGETAVLGGLLRDKETKINKKVPLLGDIPILGWLFKGSEVQKEKRNLLVFITPTIIKGKRQKEESKEILGKKLEERIHFIKKYMKGRDPHAETLKKLIPHSKSIFKDKDSKKEVKEKKSFWQRLFSGESEETDEESPEEKLDSQTLIPWEGEDGEDLQGKTPPADFLYEDQEEKRDYPLEEEKPEGDKNIEETDAVKAIELEDIQIEEDKDSGDYEEGNVQEDTSDSNVYKKDEGEELETDAGVYEKSDYDFPEQDDIEGVESKPYKDDENEETKSYFDSPEQNNTENNQESEKNTPTENEEYDFIPMSTDDFNLQ